LQSIDHVYHVIEPDDEFEKDPSKDSCLYEINKQGGMEQFEKVVLQPDHSKKQLLAKRKEDQLNCGRRFGRAASSSIRGGKV